MIPATRPLIPVDEFDDRRRRLRERLEADDIDVFIAYTDDRATFDQQHARYNYQPHFEAALSGCRSKAIPSSLQDRSQKPLSAQPHIAEMCAQ